MELYLSSFWALLAILITLFVQAVVASVAHRKQTQYVPGIINDQLSHESFVFRSHRTHQNSLENLPLLLGTAMLAIFTQFDPEQLALILWIFAVARIIHMVLYYAIATENNPSPRSYFYAIALLANVVLLIQVGLHLLP
ncbi:MAPEG family protein [Ferrimonas lipolytica]|uniref:MAPEG family protein n=1 Tax=Ferrimonas lipolytica TaxID=2724191 RepID=A0A6H1UC81_9GAMM|nr:MAPEG family protein [Ferrimonas lipolytica]QIZ76190.1 MAPEG family protein [Ferrimonas lipolytica]